MDLKKLILFIVITHQFTVVFFCVIIIHNHKSYFVVVSCLRVFLPIPPKHTTHTHTHIIAVGWVKILLNHPGMSIRGQGSARAYIVRGPGARGGHTEFCDGAVTNFIDPMKNEPAIKRSFSRRGNSLNSLSGRGEKMKLERNISINYNKRKHGKNVET